MTKKVTPKTHQNAHDLRRETNDAEAKLWTFLKSHRMHGAHFRRQHPIGKFIVDFCAPREKLIVEIDGSQHLENEVSDNARTKYLESRGYLVVRFWDNQVMNKIEDVLQEIERVLEE